MKAPPAPKAACFGAGGAFMRTRHITTVTSCECYFGDPSSDILPEGPYDNGKFGKSAAPKSMYWPSQGVGFLFCVPDGGDSGPEFYKGGEVMLTGAAASDIYSPDEWSPSAPTPVGPEEEGSESAGRVEEAEEIFECDLCSESENEFYPEGRNGKCERIHQRAQKNAKRCDKRKGRPGVIWGCCPSE